MSFAGVDLRLFMNPVRDTQVLQPSRAADVHTDASAARLCDSVRNGDEKAFTEFYHQWRSVVCQRARAVGGLDEQASLDVLQNVMMRVISALPRLETQAAIEAWMHATVRSCVIDRLRAETRRIRRERKSLPLQSQPGSSCDQLEEIAAVLRSLDPHDRDILSLRVIRGHTLKTIGAVLGESVGGVQGRVRRILQRLASDRRGQ